MSWPWDGGIDIKLGDDMNGFEAETQVKTVGEILPWLQKAIHKPYPTSKGFVAKFWEEATQASTRRLRVNLG